MSDTLPEYGASASLSAYYSPAGDNGQNTSYGFAPPYPVALPAMGFVEDGGGASSAATAAGGAVPEVTASTQVSELPGQDDGIVDGQAIASVMSELTYSFEILGPQTEAVPIDYIGLASASTAVMTGSGAYVDSASAEADGYIQLDNLSGPTEFVFTSSGSGVVTLQTNTVYVAVLQVTAFVNESDTPTLLQASGSASLSLAIDPGFADAAGFTIEYSPGIACFCAGTRIRTDHGDVAVENLRVGDRAATLSGGTRPIRWIGHRQLDLSRHSEGGDLCPVRIAAGAIGADFPRRDLLVSPDHAVLVDGRLLPARLLLNGATVTSERHIRRVQYFHVELDAHDILLAEGSPAESYLDTGNRAAFDNAAMPTQLRPDFIGDRHRREAGACMALTTAPDEAAAVWRHVAARAEALGWSVPTPPETVDEPDLHIVTSDGRRIDPVISSDGCCIFAVPGSSRGMRLVSRAARPSDLQAWHDDRRRLGVQVRRLTLRAGRDVVDVPMDHPMLAEGWWAVERNDGWPCRWTDGAAVLPPMQRGLMEVRLGDGMRYPVHGDVAWRLPFRSEAV